MKLRSKAITDINNIVIGGDTKSLNIVIIKNWVQKIELFFVILKQSFDLSRYVDYCVGIRHSWLPIRLSFEPKLIPFASFYVI